jgi:hypothetical protein
LNLLQPDDEAIRFLAKLGGVKVELVEVSRDAILADSFDHSMYWKYVLNHLVRPYKGRNDRVELLTTFLDFKGRRCRRRDRKGSWDRVKAIEAANTYYDGFSRKAKGWTTKIYRDRPSKRTDEKRTDEVFCVHMEWTIAGRHAISSVLDRILDLIDDGWHLRLWRQRVQFRTLTARGYDLASVGGCLQTLVDRLHLRVRRGLSVLSTDDFLLQ